MDLKPAAGLSAVSERDDCQLSACYFRPWLIWGG